MPLLNIVLSLFVVGCGLTCLETSANPYTTVLGHPDKAESRINLSQSLNGIGWIVGPLVGGQLLFSGVKIAIPYGLGGIFVLSVALVLSRIKLPDPRREHHVSDYLLAGIEGCRDKDQACLFVAYHDDSGWGGCSSNHGVYCGYYWEYGDCLSHTAGMLWGDWNVCVIETPRSSLDKRRIFRKSPRPSLPLKRAPPLTPALSPQERGRKPPSGARNRYAIRLADHQRSRQVVRAGTAWGWCRRN